MADSPRYALPYRRRREGKTDYKLRRALVKSGKPRAVVRLTNKYVTVQITDATLTGDIVRASASSRELPKLGWKGALGNLPSAYLTGALAARRAVGKGITEAILDLGLKGPTKGSKLFAVLKGLADSGLIVPHSPEKLPTMERIGGNHIATYAKSLAGEHDLYKKRFSAYLGRGLKPEDLSRQFEENKKTVSTAPLEAAKEENLHVKKSDRVRRQSSDHRSSKERSYRWKRSSRKG